MPDATLFEVQTIHVVMLSIVVLYLGMFLTRKVRFLEEYYIPPAVSGGLVCSTIFAVDAVICIVCE